MRIETYRVDGLRPDGVTLDVQDGRVIPIFQNKHGGFVRVRDGDVIATHPDGTRQLLRVVCFATTGTHTGTEDFQIRERDAP